MKSKPKIKPAFGWGAVYLGGQLDIDVAWSQRDMLDTQENIRVILLPLAEYRRMRSELKRYADVLGICPQKAVGHAEK